MRSCREHNEKYKNDHAFSAPHELKPMHGCSEWKNEEIPSAAYGPTAMSLIEEAEYVRGLLSEYITVLMRQT